MRFVQGDMHRLSQFNVLKHWRRLIAASLLLSSGFHARAQMRDYGRGDVSRFDGPLPEWADVGLFLLAGVGLWLVGWLLFKISSALERNGESSSLSTSVGCLGALVSLAAFGGLIPLLMWVEQIGLALLFAAGIVIVAIVLFTMLKGWLKKH